MHSFTDDWISSMRKRIRWLLFRDLEALPSKMVEQLILQAAVFPSKRIGMARQYVVLMCCYLCLMFTLHILISFKDGSDDSTLSYVLLFFIPIVGAALMVLMNNYILRRRVERMVRTRWINGRPPNCLACDYDLRGSDGPTCPECGGRIPCVEDIVRKSPAAKSEG